jgi:hypothetical protein
MSSVAYVEQQLQSILEERANELARETGCIKRERKFSGADVVQTLVFGWQQHPDASLEQLASTAEVREVSVTDTAVHKRFTPECAQFLHAVLEEMTSEVMQAAHEVPIRLLRRFSAVILEDSSSIALPDELVEVWRGCGGNQSHTAAGVKLHTRCELKRGRLEGPKLTDGRTSDHASPFNEQAVVPGSLQVEDLGYFSLSAAGSTASGRGVLVDALPGRNGALQHPGPAPAGSRSGPPTGGSDERAARASGGDSPSADASTAATGAQEDRRQAARGLAG